MKGRGEFVGGSLSFDGAADIYDATRALPPAIAAKQTDALLAELRAVRASRLLEVGIGTGRISRPVMARGARVCGVDIAPRMLARLRQQLGPEHAMPDLVLGDATVLPLRDASFRAILLVHVLHLVSDWRTALAETRRVLTPRGVVLHDRTRYDDDNPWHSTFRKREDLLRSMGYEARRRPTVEEIEGELTSLGASLRTVTYAEDDETEVASEVLKRAHNRVDSWTWEIPEEIYREFLPRYEAYLREDLGSLDASRITHLTYELDVWSFP